MQFVKQDNRRGFRCDVQSTMFRNGLWPFQNDLLMGPVVPVQIKISGSSGGCGFPDLSRAAEENHLAVVLKVLTQKGIVNSRDEIHGSIMQRFAE